MTTEYEITHTDENDYRVSSYDTTSQPLIVHGPLGQEVFIVHANVIPSNCGMGLIHGFQPLHHDAALTQEAFDYFTEYMAHSPTVLERRVKILATDAVGGESGGVCLSTLCQNSDKWVEIGERVRNPNSDNLIHVFEYNSPELQEKELDEEEDYDW